MEWSGVECSAVQCSAVQCSAWRVWRSRAVAQAHHALRSALLSLLQVMDLESSLEREESEAAIEGVAQVAAASHTPVSRLGPGGNVWLD